MLKPSWSRGDAGGKISSDAPLPPSAAAPLGAVTESFLAYVRGKRTLMVSLLGVTAFLAVVAVTQGAYDISPGHLLRVLTGSAVGPADIVVWKIRLPRIMSAIVVGWGLSLSGLGIQSLLKNPLGSPSTLGISQGAAFGAAAAIVIFGQQMVSVTVFAFAGAMAAGEVTAKGLGVNVNRMRLHGMLAAALVAALATAFHGVIAFVGLIAPHIARKLVGGDHGLLIPFSAIIGALLLLTADTFGRALIGSGALPVGIITSFMGAPMFLFLLVRGYR